MKMKCKHCKKEFTDTVKQTLCEDCRNKMQVDGTLRMCDHCGHTWEVEAGECGALWEATCPERVLELCAECAVKFGVE